MILRSDKCDPEIVNSVYAEIVGVLFAPDPSLTYAEAFEVCVNLTASLLVLMLCGDGSNLSAKAARALKEELTDRMRHAVIEAAEIHGDQQCLASDEQTPSTHLH